MSPSAMLGTNLWEYIITSMSCWASSPQHKPHPLQLCKLLLGGQKCILWETYQRSTEVHSPASLQSHQTWSPVPLGQESMGDGCCTQWLQHHKASCAHPSLPVPWQLRAHGLLFGMSSHPAPCSSCSTGADLPQNCKMAVRDTAPQCSVLLCW